MYSVHQEKVYRETREQMLDTLGSEALVDEHLQPPIRYAKIPGDPGYVDFRLGRRRYQTRHEFDNLISVPEFWDAEGCLAHPYEYRDLKNQIDPYRIQFENQRELDRNRIRENLRNTDDETAAARRETDRIRKKADRLRNRSVRTAFRTPSMIRNVNRMRKSKYREKIYLEQREQMLSSLGSESLPPRRKNLTWDGNLLNL